jgi:DNA-3-methyladenine glycosylase II
VHVIRASGRELIAVVSLAEHFVDGRLSTELLRDGTDEEVAKALIAVRGIGQVRPRLTSDGN